MEPGTRSLKWYRSSTTSLIHDARQNSRSTNEARMSNSKSSPSTSAGDFNRRATIQFCNPAALNPPGTRPGHYAALFCPASLPPRQSHPKESALPMQRKQTKHAMHYDAPDYHHDDDRSHRQGPGTVPWRKQRPNQSCRQVNRRPASETLVFGSRQIAKNWRNIGKTSRFSHHLAGQPGQKRRRTEKCGGLPQRGDNHQCG